MLRTTFIFLLAITTLGAVAKAADDVRYYDVETIIFESLDPAARQSENWKSEINRETPPVVAELDQPYPGEIPKEYNPSLTFKTLPESSFQLNDEEKLLTNSKQYRILLHTAWVQPGMPPDIALPVHILRNFITETPVTHSLIPATPDMPPSNIPAPDTPRQTRSVLDGYIKIILTRYLHADVDLTYTMGLPLTPTDNSGAPATASNSSQTTTIPSDSPGASMTPNSTTTDATTSAALFPPPVVYRLKESRRMRSKELHYLDHPVLGMLLQITQHEDEKASSTSKRR